MNIGVVSVLGYDGNAAVDTCVRVFVWTHVFISLGWRPGVELLGPRVYFCSTSKAEPFSELAALCHILPPGFTDEKLETQRG